MWIRRTVRLCVVALFAIETSIIAMATAASATPIPPGKDLGEELVPIIRIEDAFKAPRWIDSLEYRNDGLDWTYGGARSLAPRHEHAAHRIREAGRHVRDIGWSDYRVGPPAHRTRWHDYDAGWRSRAHEALEGTDSRGKRRVKLARVKPRYATMHLSHSHATRWLKQAGLRWTSSGGCANRHVRHCTSLESVRTATVQRMVQLKKRSGCSVTVTGGTETGHAPGRFSHGSGHKLDIGHNKCIDRYIKKIAEPAGVRGDGARLYRSPSGTVFADESDHWDILFR